MTVHYLLSGTRTCRTRSNTTVTSGCLDALPMFGSIVMTVEIGLEAILDDLAERN